MPALESDKKSRSSRKQRRHRSSKTEVGNEVKGERSLNSKRNSGQQEEKTRKEPVKEIGSNSEVSTIRSQRMSTSTFTPTTATGSSGTAQLMTLMGNDANLWQRYIQKDPFLTGITVVSLVFGIILGFVLKLSQPLCYWNPRRTSYVGLFGQLFTNILNSVKIPLVFTSIIASIGSADFKTVVFIGTRGLAYTFVMMIIGSTLGTLSSLAAGSQLANFKDNCNASGTCGTHCPFWSRRTDGSNDFRCGVRGDVTLDLFRNLVPNNFVEIFFRTNNGAVDFSLPDAGYSLYKYQDCLEYLRSNASGKPGPEAYGITQLWILSSNSNVMGVFSIAALVGVCCLWVGESSKEFINVCISCSEVFLNMSKWALWLSPLGISSLAAANVVSHTSPWNHSSFLVLFAGVSIGTLLIFLLLVMPFAYWVVIRKMPFKFYRSMLPVIVTSFGTASSAGTLPMTIKALEELSRLDPRVVRLFAPVAVLINVPGTAAFVAQSATMIFLKNGGTMDLETFLLIIVSSTFVSMVTSTGLPGIEGLEIYSLLAFIRMDADNAKITLPMEWVMDPFMTALNVMGDCVGSAILYHWCKKHLRHLAKEAERFEKEMDLHEKNKEWDQIVVPPTPTPTAPSVNVESGA